MLALSYRTTKGSVMTHQPTPATAPAGVLLLADVARICTEEARKKYDERAAKRDRVNARRLSRGRDSLPPLREFTPITVSTVRSYRKESKQMVGKRPGRYRDNPVPPAAGALGTARQAPWWPETDEQKWRDWWNSRPGHGHGTGGRYA